MPRFAINIRVLYPEHALVDRIGAATRDGFVAVEVRGTCAVDAGKLRRAHHDACSRVALMNTPVGGFTGGE